MIVRTHHTGLTVSDLDRSLTFYRDLLGLELIDTAERRSPEIRTIVGMPDAVIRMAWLRVPGRPEHIVELLEYVAPGGQPVDTRTNNPGTLHLAFAVSDLQGLHARLSAHGVPSRSEPVQLKEGPNAGGWAVYLSDPDGITVELLQPKS